MVASIAALLLAAVAAIVDVRTERIPNWLTLGAGAAAIGAHAGGSWLEGLDAVLGVVVCCAVTVPLHTRGTLGGGDVKLFAALGAILLAPLGLVAIALSFLALKASRPRIRKAMGPTIFAGVATITLLEFAHAHCL